MVPWLNQELVQGMADTEGDSGLYPDDLHVVLSCPLAQHGHILLSQCALLRGYHSAEGADVQAEEPLIHYDCCCVPVRRTLNQKKLARYRLDH